MMSTCRSTRFRSSVFAMFVVWGATPSRALAGMPSIGLSDVVGARLDVISFFLVVYLLLAWAVKGLWNGLAKTFERLPCLGYRHALGLMLVSGLLLYVVLTMIAGARELMTPGAWEKQGLTYRLRQPANERVHAMETLKSKLWNFAAEHGGKFPESLFDPAFQRKEWLHSAGGYYCYLPPGTNGINRNGIEGVNRAILVYEPATAGRERIVLLNDGAIESWAPEQLKKRLHK